MIVFLADWVKIIPMAALVAIMIMLATVIAVVSTPNLAISVPVGVLFSGILFAWKIAQIFRMGSIHSADERTRTYIVEGQLFFASSDAFTDAVDFTEVLEKAIIDVSKAQISGRFPVCRHWI